MTPRPGFYWLREDERSACPSKLSIGYFGLVSPEPKNDTIQLYILI